MVMVCSCTLMDNTLTLLGSMISLGQYGPGSFFLITKNRPLAVFLCFDSCKVRASLVTNSRAVVYSTQGSPLDMLNKTFNKSSLD